MTSNGRSTHYRDLWKRTRVREQELLATIALMKKDNKAEVDQLKATIKERDSQLSHMKHMVFGRSTEKKKSLKTQSGKAKQKYHTTTDDS